MSDETKAPAAKPEAPRPSIRDLESYHRGPTPENQARSHALLSKTGPLVVADREGETLVRSTRYRAAAKGQIRAEDITPRRPDAEDGDE